MKCGECCKFYTFKNESTISRTPALLEETGRAVTSSLVRERWRLFVLSLLQCMGTVGWVDHMLAMPQHLEPVARGPEQSSSLYSVTEHADPVIASLISKMHPHITQEACHLQLPHAVNKLSKKRNVLSLSTAFIFRKLNMCKYLYEHQIQQLRHKLNKFHRHGAAGSLVVRVLD